MLTWSFDANYLVMVSALVFFAGLTVICIHVTGVVIEPNPPNNPKQHDIRPLVVMLFLLSLITAGALGYYSGSVYHPVH